MRFRATPLAVAALVVTVAILPSQAAPKAGSRSVDVRELREWLTYIASDDLQGRAVFSSGLGLAESSADVGSAARDAEHVPQAEIQRAMTQGGVHSRRLYGALD